MKVPYRWITSLVDCQGQSAAELARTLTLLGLEAEEAAGLDATFAGVIAAAVRAVTPRDKGSLLTLSDGAEEYTVYSTAPGIAAGQIVAFAPPGATVAGLAVTAQTFGDITSEGMVCSAQELGIGRESHDLLELPGIAPGTDLKALLFNDHPIALEYPSNRGDVLSLLGVGRELAAHFRAAWPAFELSPAAQVIRGSAEHQVGHPLGRITITALDLCPRYAARIITGVRVDDSPPELLARLTSLGLKPINNIVDITNIVLMELGQPLHPFDFDRLAGGEIIVRRAAESERFTTLDGIERTLTAHDLLIADRDRGIALAGVMGGKESEVGWDTTRVLLESARFDKVAIRRTARRQSLRTDASLRFERGIDPALVEQALDRVAWYLERYQCGQVEPVTLSAGVSDPSPRTIVADLARIGPLLGADISQAQAVEILKRLGFTSVTERAGEWDTITVPSWRADVVLAEDLAEEVARHHGYNNIPAVLPQAPMKTEVRPPQVILRFALKRELAAMGYRELMTFPQGNEGTGAVPNPLRPGSAPIEITNALSREQSVMARSLVPGVLDALRTNQRNRLLLPRCFELNKVYWREGASFHEAEELVLCIAREPGPLAEEQAFREVKGALEALCNRYHLPWECRPDEHQIAPYATGLSAHWCWPPALGDAPKAQGLLGVLDPQWTDRWDIPYVVALAQLPWEPLWQALQAHAARRFAPLPRHPAVTRDLALVVPEGVRYGELAATVRAHGGPYLMDLGLFDVYRGKPVPQEHKSLALTLRFQDPEATLTDETVNAALEAILSATASAHRAVLRG